MSARPSLVEKAKRLQQSEFVGRSEQLKLFRENLRLNPEDDRFHNIFFVYGQAGVGKTSLVLQFQSIARMFNAVTAYIDENVQDIPHAMGLMAEQFEHQGEVFSEFQKRFQLYQQKKLELESDQEAPKGFAALMGRIVARGGLHAVNKIPGAGVIKEFIDEDQVVNLASEWASYVARKISNKDDLKLLVDPVKVLSHLFFQSLGQASDRRNLVLFIDTYEKTGPLLEEWLLSTLSGAFGDVPINLLIVLSGQTPYDTSVWGNFAGLTTVMPLEAFTPEETREYLEKKNINDPKIVEMIIESSNGLPLLVATLSRGNPRDVSDIGDPNDTAIMRFLKWVEDPLKRKISLQASLPHWIDKDLLRIVAGEADLDSQFQWLKAMPFIREQNGKWVYHSIVRDAMQKSLRNESPQEWSTLHDELHGYYQNRLGELGLNEEAGWPNTEWRFYTLEALYHLLSAYPYRYLSKAINLFVRLLHSNYFVARDVANVILEAGQATGAQEVIDWGQRLLNGLEESENYKFDPSIQMFSEIIAYHPLQPELLWVAYGWRAEHERLSEQFDRALEDFDRAIELNPDNASLLASRGEVLRRMGNPKLALLDFDRAIELNPQYVWARTRRAEIYRRTHREKEAAQELTRVLEINPEYHRALADRGAVYMELRQYDKALEDLNHSLAINPEYMWALSERGELYRRRREYPEAIRDFSRLLELDPSDYWVLTRLGDIYREQKKFDMALDTYNKALEIKPKYVWALAGRGEIYRIQKDYPLALQDLNFAISLKPDFLWAIEKRALIYHKTGEFEKGLSDFDRVIKRFDKNPELIAKRASILRHLRRYPEALQDYLRVLELEPGNEWHHYQAGMLMILLGEPQTGKDHLQKAIELANSQLTANPDSQRIELQIVLFRIARQEYPVGEPPFKDPHRSVEQKVWDEFLYNVGQYLIHFPEDVQASQVKEWLIQTYGGSSRPNP